MIVELDPDATVVVSVTDPLPVVQLIAEVIADGVPREYPITSMVEVTAELLIVVVALEIVPVAFMTCLAGVLLVPSDELSMAI